MSEARVLLKEAIGAAKAGNRLLARTLFLEVVELEPRTEVAWLWLSELVDDPRDQMIALENALTINPARPRVRARLKHLRGQIPISAALPGRDEAVEADDLLAQAKEYEARGELAQALQAYKTAAHQAPVDADRLIARRRQARLQAQYDQVRPVKSTRRRVTVGRMAAGPSLLYGLLILTHGGLNPLQVPLLFYLGFASVAGGSFLLAAATHLPSHALWRAMLGEEELRRPEHHLLIMLLGLGLVLLPFLLFWLSAAARLGVYRNLTTFPSP